MNATNAFVMQWESWTLLLSILAVVITAILSWITWQRSGFKNFVGLLEACRIVLVVCTVLLLNQPEWIEEFKPVEKPTLVILGDDSGSMVTRDVVVQEGSRSTAKTRRDAIASWMNEDAWKSLEDRFEVVVQTIPTDATTGGTDLHRAMMDVRDKYPYL